MKRYQRITMAIGLALCMVALYWLGPEPEVCGNDCTHTPKLGVGVAIFLVVLLVGLRLIKKFSDLIRRYD